MIIFYSKSANHKARYLSNFQNLSPLLKIPDDFFIPSLRGISFISVENAFQACKTSAGYYDLEKIIEFTNCTPQEAKILGSKKNLKINTFIWNQISYRCMYELIKLRIKSDGKFYEIIKSEGPFYHFDRSGSKSYWGGYFEDGVWLGRNNLGEIFNTLSEIFSPDRHRTEGFC